MLCLVGVTGEATAEVGLENIRKPEEATNRAPMAATEASFLAKENHMFLNIFILGISASYAVHGGREFVIQIILNSLVNGKITTSDSLRSGKLVP